MPPGQTTGTDTAQNTGSGQDASAGQSAGTTQTTSSAGAATQTAGQTQAAASGQTTTNGQGSATSQAGGASQAAAGQAAGTGQAASAQGAGAGQTAVDPAADYLAKIAELKAANERNQAEIARMAGEALTAERTRMLAELGVKPQYHEFAPPNLDPRKPDERAKLEKWAADRPEIRTGQTKPPPTDQTKVLEEQAKKYGKSPLFDANHLKANAAKNGINL